VRHIIITPLSPGLYRVEPSYEVIYDATFTAVELLELAAWVEERKVNLIEEAERSEKTES